MNDLWKEFVDYGRSEFSANGINSDAITEDGLPLAYLNWLKRAVPVLPRKILKSNNFLCPPEYIDSLSEVEEKISKGKSLQSHLSTSLRNPAFNDLMLNDWGIYHLHLGLYLRSDGFVERTGQLLYARFDELNAYLIGIVPSHGLWTHKDIIQVIHENWPSTIERYRVKGVGADTSGYSDNELGNIRKKHANAFIYIEPGVVYMGPGGGLMSSGASAETIRLHDSIYINTRGFEIYRI